MNTGWHRQHPMPKNASREQRVQWHIEHQQHCLCRPIPLKVLDLLAGATTPVPLRARRPTSRRLRAV
jgi:hypothetical protein